MNKRNLLIGLAALGLALIATRHIYEKSFTAPGKNEKKMAEDANGARDWWFNIRKDENGQLNMERMEAVREQVMQQFRSRSMNAWPLTFQEIGPDNVGGRTRALCYDRNNSSHMFTGGVSGGLWESHDGGSNWTHNPAWDQFDVLTITSIVQAVNGDWYFGTGESIYNGEFIGGGIWKSTDNGLTWRHLASTGTYAPTSNGSRWSNIGKLAVDPVNFKRIYAGTYSGLMVSSDSGATFVAAQNNIVGAIPDVDVASNSAVFVVSSGGSFLYKSANGDPGTYTRVSGGYPQTSLGRSEVAISPTDPNYIYSVSATTNNDFKGAWMSVDGGTSWTQIGFGPSSILNPFGTSPYLQGYYDMTLAVDPWDKGHIFLGGVNTFEWKLVSNNPIFGQWTQLSPSFISYVHSDQHIILFHPTIPGDFFIGCDGGLYHTVDNGLHYIPSNKHYAVTQCYAIAADYSDPSRSVTVAGCQDNGTQFINRLGNTPASAVAINGGDGFQTEFSFLNPNAIFSTIYYGSLYRTSNRGFGSEFYNARINAYTNPSVGSSGFADFVTPIRLWESLSDQFSSDSVAFVATHQSHPIAHGNGTRVQFTDTLQPNFNGDPELNASIIPGSAVVTTGTVTLTDNGSGVLTGVGGSGTINYATKGVVLNYTTAPGSSQLITINYDITYNAGVTIGLRSHTNNIGFSAVTPVTLSSLGPNDTLFVKDVVQSKTAVGFTSNTSTNRGVFMTKGAIDFSKDPVWVKIAGINSLPDSYTTSYGGTTLLEWSKDGNTLYVSTDNGNLYRLDNVGEVRDTIQGDVDVHSGSVDIRNPRCPVRCTRIGTFSNYISAIDIDPNNQDNLLVTCGNYSPANHVFYCQNATTAPSMTGTGNFTDVMGNLPGMPVYSGSFDKYNPGHVLLGTEYGVYTTDNINNVSVSWAPQNSGFARVPVMQIRQSRWDPWNGCQNSGVFYLATFGRGMWKSETSYLPMGIADPGAGSSIRKGLGLLVYPNPMNGPGKISVNLSHEADATLRVFNLSGKLCRELKIPGLTEGQNILDFDSSGLDAGTYLVSLDAGNQHAVARFVVLK